MTLAIVFGIYLAAMAGVGLYCSRFNKNLDDFVLGGRKLGPWVAAFSAQASDFSGWLLIALPAAAYAGGFSMVWTCIGCSLGVMFNWMVLAPRLHKYSVAGNALTIPDFLETRFNDRTRIIRVLSVLTILVFYVVYISAQFNAAGDVFRTAFAGRVPWGETNITFYHQGLLIGAVIILGYTAVGGFMAVCWTDFVQAILMVSAVVVVPIFAVLKLGGFSEAWAAMVEHASSDMFLALDNGQAGTAFTFGVVLSGLAWGVGYPGQPHIVARYMAIEDPRKIAKSSFIAIVWSLIALYGSLFVGLTARAVLDVELVGKDQNMAMPLLALELLPEVLAALVLSAGVAAMMSTVDSQIIVAVSAVVSDIYVKLLGGHPSGRTAVWLSRLVVVAFGVAGVWAAWKSEKVFDTVLNAWGGLAAGLGPAIVLGSIWRRASRSGVIVGMIAGVLMTQFWNQIMDGVTRLGGSLANAVPHLNSIQLLVCVGVNLGIVVIISLFVPSTETEGQ